MKNKRKLFLCLLTLGLFIAVFSGEKVEAKKSKYPYWIKVNKQCCVVTIYKQDKKGNYTVPVKAFRCSPGNATPVGTFSLKEKMRWHTLMGPCYGQYCSRIVGGILFHSVWYYKPNPATLSYRQYNLLGQRVSHGCVRVTVKDAKWIFDNCSSGTKVTIYNSSNPGPLGKPATMKLSGYMGYDPTDIWSKGNPYNKKQPILSGAKNSTIAFGAKVNLTKGVSAMSSTGGSMKKIKTKISHKGFLDKKFVKVSKINSKKPGSYKVTYVATDIAGKTASKTVVKTVKVKTKIKKFDFGINQITLFVGGDSNQKKTKITVKALPKNASFKEYIIASSNTKIATVSSKGEVVAKKAGNCVITAKAKDGSGVVEKLKVTVLPAPAITPAPTEEPITVPEQTPAA